MPVKVGEVNIKEKIRKIFRRKAPEGGEGRKVYELRMMGQDGGWYRTGIKFDSPISPQEAAQFLGPGRYWLVEVEPGKPGFRKVWDKPLEVRYEAPVEQPVEERRERRRKPNNPVADIVASVMELAQNESARQSLAESIKLLKRIFVGPDLEDALDILAQHRDKIAKAAKVFGIGEGRGYTEEEGPEYEGKIPAWLHPRVVRTIRTEIRGVLKDIKNELAGGGEEETNIPEFPEEPKGGGNEQQ